MCAFLSRCIQTSTRHVSRYLHTLRYLHTFGNLDHLKTVPLPVRLFRPVQDNFPVGFFNGALKRDKCGSGMSIYLSPGKFYHFVWYSGGGSNTRAELLAMSGVLFYARWLDIEVIYIFGDSKVVVDWAIGKSTMQTPDLTNWQNGIKLLLKDFNQVSISHIYRGTKQ